MRIQLLFMIVLGNVVSIFSQQFDQNLTNIVPPSPTASSLGKYGEIPVSYNIGSPSISIPIYEISSEGISVPVSLSYHASGIRVEDNASWVGLGWSLSAGGVITRSVRGSADDAQNGLLNNNLPTNAQILDPNQAQNINQFFGPQASPDGTGVQDREPDLFYYNFMGASGKLYFDENNVVIPKPYASIKVEPIFSGGEIDTWTITDQNGIKYYFGENNNTISGLGKEITSTGSQPSHTSAWYLVRVFNPKTNGNIYFEYDDLTSKVEKPKNQSLEWYFHQPIFGLAEFQGLNTLPPNPDFQSPSSTKTTVYGNRVLRRILFSNGKVEFTTTANRTDIEDEVELDKIEIFNSTNLLKSFQFNYDFIGKLYLNGVDEYDKATQEYKPYTFQYESKIPTGAVYDQDFWGFYNASGNNNLIPAIYSVNNPYGQYQANRLPNESAMKRGVLKQITYPTKGSTEFVYEAHRAFTPQVGDMYGPFLLNNGNNVNLSSVQGEYKEALFSIETEQNILFEIDFTYFREEYNINRPAAYLHKLESGQWNEVRPRWAPNYPAVADESFDTSILLSPGEYRFSLTDMPCSAPPCNVAQPDELEKIFVTYAKFSYLGGTTADLSNTEIMAGGLRINKIINKDSNGALIDQKKYTYQDGKLITFPVHYSTYDQLIVDSGAFNVPMGCWEGSTMGSPYKVHNISSNSLAVLGSAQGSHVVYSKVIEELVDGNDESNGLSEYHYYFPDINPIDNTTSEPPFAPQDDISDITNKLDLHIIRNKNGNIVKAVDYSYSFDNQEIPRYPVNGLAIHNKRKMPLIPPESCTVLAQEAQSFLYDYAFYDVETYWVKLDSVKTIDYDDNGQNPISSTTQYYYENVDHLQPTRIETINSKGETSVTKTYYPQDVTAVSSLGSPNLSPDEFDAIELLKEPTGAAPSREHRIAEPIQTETTINGNTTVQRTNYKTFPVGLTLSKSVATSKGGLAMEERLNYHRYDAHGNPLEASRANGTIISYIWGHNGQYPIAKIENASYADIAAELGITETILEGYDHSNLAQINGLRTNPNLTQAMITTYTYDLLVGVTSTTDPRGYTTTYIYDSFNRLKEIRDGDSNLVSDYLYNYKN
ncbi:hypothetical protein [Flagellimonas sp.]|uniref:hypothetical protein n=1 Tax=Flagellimonas sp. TaxID=2058762 RepID=UPI003B5B87C6